MNTPVPVPGSIREPYTELFIAVRERCSAEIEQMERARQIAPLSDRQLVIEEWEEYSPGLILATVEWHAARIVMTWAVDDDHPTRAPRSPEHVVDLTDLAQASLATERPREYFECHAVYALQVAQHYLIDFYRDGPTDDIPYERQLVVVRGTEFTDDTVLATDFVVPRERHHC